jgi:hypothetical protein
VDLEATWPSITITQGIAEISKVGRVYILASHPRERLLSILMEVDGAKELTDR